ncbi:MAG: FAD:protein FMN transferase [Solirubrobacteraceae bacterium]
MSIQTPRIYIDRPGVEAIESFPCFGGHCSVRVTGRGPAGTAREAALHAKRRLLDWHRQFSRFEAGSELSALNADPRATVPVSAEMARFVELALRAAAMTGGLVDPTLVGDIERAGYARHHDGNAIPLSRALALAPARAAGAAGPAAAWREVAVDRDAGTVTRQPGVRLDSGGIVKGMFGDILAGELGGHAAFAVDAAGDVTFGGSAGLLRPVRVASPFDESILHVFDLVRGAAATSGIGRRSWLDGDGRPAHHLLDPATGRPAFTGIVQVTACARSGAEAEARSKAALLSGPAGAHDWLPDGGVVVYDDGSIDVVGSPRNAADLRAAGVGSLSSRRLLAAAEPCPATAIILVDEDTGDHP